MNSVSVTIWLLDAAALAGMILLLASAIYGLALLVWPRAALQASAHLNRAYSSRRAMKPLEVPRKSEPFFYRHHRKVGWLLLVGVGTFFALYFIDFPRNTILMKLSQRLGAPVAGIVLDALTYFLFLTNSLIAVFAGAMIARPSSLKALESWSNRWLSTRQALRNVEISRDPLDRFAARFPRLAGLLILLSAGYITLSLLVVAG